MRKLLILTLATASLFAQERVRLADVRKIYIEKMDNGLDQYLKSAISKKFRGRLIIVLDKSQADAILSGVQMGAQHTGNATVNLTDPRGHVVLWSGTAGDRNGMFLNLKHGGEEKVADHLAAQLKKAMEH